MIRSANFVLPIFVVVDRVVEEEETVVPRANFAELSACSYHKGFSRFFYIFVAYNNGTKMDSRQVDRIDLVCNLP